MRIQASTNQHKQNFGAIALTVPKMSNDNMFYTMSLLSDFCFGTQIVKGVNNKMQDVLIINTPYKTLKEKVVLSSLKQILNKYRILNKRNVISDGTVNKYFENHEKKIGGYSWIKYEDLD